MTTRSIELVVFDLDGTLLDSVPDLASAANQTLDRLGYPMLPQNLIRDFVGNGADVLLARALSGGIDIDPALSAELRQQARILFDAFYADTQHRQSQLYPTVKTTLRKLQTAGISMALLTNKPSQFIPAILAQHDIAECFIDIIGGDTFSHRKPDPMALHWLMAKHQLSPEQVLMVGDSKHDIQAAKGACCYAFGLTYGYNHGEPIQASRPDFVGDQLSDLLDILSLDDEVFTDQLAALANQ